MQAVRLETLSRPARAVRPTRARRQTQRAKEAELDEDDDDTSDNNNEYERSTYQLRKRRRISYADADEENALNDGETAKANSQAALSPEGVPLDVASDVPMEQGILKKSFYCNSSRRRQRSN